MNHLIELWAGDCINQISKINDAVGERNRLQKLGGKTRLVSHFQRWISVNVLSGYCRKLPMGRRGSLFVGEAIDMTLGRFLV